ncbi:MAG: MFS transporter [Bacteroidetes bacterium]|nr:MFS transporter [Bacteroidota bacterium]
MSFSSSLQIFKHKEFKWFIYARFFVTLAIQMQMSTIYLQIYYEHSRNELTLGLIGLSEVIPFIITSFFSGHIADVMSRRRILIVGCLALLLGSMFLWAFSSEYFPSLKLLGASALFSVVFIFGIIRAFLAAATQPFMSQLVDRSQYTQATTWNTTVWHTAAILGPVLAGLIYGYHDARHADWCYAVNCLLFLGCVVSYLVIKSKPIPEKTKDETLLQSLSSGLKFVFNNNMIFSALSLDMFAVLFGGAVAIIPAYTDKILHLGPEAYGLLRTAPAIGAVLTSFVLAFKQPGKRAGFDLLWTVAAFGVCTILFALCTNYWMAFAMLLLTGAFDNVSVVVRHTILQLMTPDNMRGRVSAVNSIFVGSSNEIGAFESGAAARLMGLVPSIVFGGIMTIGVVLGVNKLNPQLKKLDLKELE